MGAKIHIIFYMCNTPRIFLKKKFLYSLSNIQYPISNIHSPFSILHSLFFTCTYNIYKYIYIVYIL